MHWDPNDAHLLVTGGAGFIGSTFIHFVLDQQDFNGHLSNIDLLTYAADLANLDSIKKDSRYTFFHGDICDTDLLEMIHKQRPITAIIHFAAETHVDRSISNPDPFMRTNIIGTYTLLKFIRKHPTIHFHHISTDEVYGSLGKEGVFTETSPYRPNSPYAASKASADHLIRSYTITYQLSTTLSHGTNTYGPRQDKEKFIPLMVARIFEKKPLPLYGKGENIREWLFVEDHVRAIWTILQQGKKGEAYNIGGGCPMSNTELLHLLFTIIADLTGERIDQNLITYVPDRLGHDFRYAMDGTKMKQLGYHPRWSLRQGLTKTIQSIQQVFV